MLRLSKAAIAHSLPNDTCNGSDLTAVVEAWDRLPDVIKAGIVAMVRTALLS
jgi:hypothetical protein